MTTTTSSPIIVWFRRDLRLDDNLALKTAVETDAPIVPLFINEPAPAPHLELGGAQKWWLHKTLEALAAKLNELGADLVLQSGDPLDVLKKVIAETNADAVYWNRRYTPEHIEIDTALKSSLKDDGIDVKSFDGHLMHEPTQVKTKTGGFYRVYTPFWKSFYAARDEIVRPAIDAPDKLTSGTGVASEKLEDWKLLPTKPNWSGGLAETWTPGEAGAHERLAEFLDNGVSQYDDERDLPSTEGTSRLSPHLTFGEISPSRIWHTTLDNAADTTGRTTFLKELVWREFSYHLLVNTGDLANGNYNAQFDQFPWDENEERLKAWQKGATGYPIVDAGMRQLYETGWMHNRVRMIVGSFLVKHLLLDWRHGERWFWDTLVDADPASNAAGWQWVAGSGADAAPYFRIFNPMTQGEKFDPKGEYVKRFVPELEKVPPKFIHKPWEAPKNILEYADVTLGATYPHPIVDHQQARTRALDAYQTMRGKAA